MVKRLPYQKQRKPMPVLPKGGLRRSSDPDREPELLTGTVKGFKASKPEERAANALYANKQVSNFFFRMTIGAESRNLPGWKELDFLIETTTGMYYPVEVDSAFSHRLKGTSDILHDAIVLENLKHLNVYPKVIHWDQDHDLPNAAVAKQTVKNLVG